MDKSSENALMNIEVCTYELAIIQPHSYFGKASRIVAARAMQSHVVVVAATGADESAALRQIHFAGCACCRKMELDLEEIM